ncbi:hypothetical protein HYR69_02995 [Candidatus Sumerlaeota bacterium]|nr:hypothetical protein [Candidatus Sumerlaeota bacterium]
MKKVRSSRSITGVLAVLGSLSLACTRNTEETAHKTLGGPTIQEFGGATQELQDRGNYIYCRVCGRGTVFGGVSGMKEVFRYARANNQRRILLDLWDADVTKLSVPEIIAGTFSLLPIWDFSTRISVHMPDETLPNLVNRFSFPEGRIRLIKMRRFAKLEDAEVWLLADE